MSQTLLLYDVFLVVLTVLAIALFAFIGYSHYQDSKIFKRLVEEEEKDHFANQVTRLTPAVHWDEFPTERRTTPRRQFVAEYQKRAGK